MTNISALSTIPYNKSLLQATKHTFIFPTLPFLKYFIQSVNLPGISTSPVQVSNPFADMFRHGDKLVFEGLVISALIDEDLRVWEETKNWLYALTTPEKFSQYIRYDEARRKESPYHDGELTLYTNSNVPNMRFKFTECHPIAMSGINFSTIDNADNVLTSEIMFRYDQFFLERF